MVLRSVKDLENAIKILEGEYETIEALKVEVSNLKSVKEKDPVTDSITSPETKVVICFQSDWNLTLWSRTFFMTGPLLGKTCDSFSTLGRWAKWMPKSKRPLWRASEAFSIHQCPSTAGQGGNDNPGAAKWPRRKPKPGYFSNLQLLGWSGGKKKHILIKLSVFHVL